MVRPRLAATRSGGGTASRQLTKQKEQKEKVEQKATDVQFELKGAKAKITQFESREGRVQEDFGHIIRQIRRLKAGIDSVLDQLDEDRQLDLHNHLGRSSLLYVLRRQFIVVCFVNLFMWPLVVVLTIEGSD